MSTRDTMPASPATQWKLAALGQILNASHTVRARLRKEWAQFSEAERAHVLTRFKPEDREKVVRFMEEP